MFSTGPRTLKYHLSYGNLHQADMNGNMDPCIIKNVMGLGWDGLEESVSGCCKNCVLAGLEVIHHRRLQLLS
jgi:hypothetical protein